MKNKLMALLSIVGVVLFYSGCYGGMVWLASERKAPETPSYTTLKNWEVIKDGVLICTNPTAGNQVVECIK